MLVCHFNYNIDDIHVEILLYNYALTRHLSEENFYDLMQKVGEYRLQNSSFQLGYKLKHHTPKE